MSSPAPFSPIADIIDRTISIRHVYGEPVQHGDTIVIPVASVAYGFGAGGGRRLRRMGGAAAGPSGQEMDPDEGGGGGGGVRMTPEGVFELGSKGTRFIRCRQLGPLVGVAAAALVAGWLLGHRR